MKIRVVLLTFVVWLTACGGQPSDAATQTLNSLQKVDDHLYVMTYVGDYGFKEFLQIGLAANDRSLLPATSEWAGLPVRCVLARFPNPKLTTAADLAVIRALAGSAP